MDIPRDWTFKTSQVATGFDRHVREQLPWYDLMSGAVAHLARHYIPDNGVVYDLGCSTGNIGNLIRETLTARNATIHPIDNAESMREHYKGPGEIEIADITEIEIKPFDVAVLFLCLMFIPIRKRRELIGKLRSKVNSGGAIIVVDKMESQGGYLGTAISRLTLAGKVASGVPADQIIAKEMSLCGVQRPLSQRDLGVSVELFRFGEFAGWVIESCPST